MKSSLSILFASAVIGLAAAPAEATLTTIGTADYHSVNYNLVYDDDSGLIWLDYSNACDTCIWESQMNWAAGLNAPGVLTYNINPGLTVNWSADWRLPQMVDTGTSGCDWAYSSTDCGFNVYTATGELAHLYYDELGNLGYLDASGNYQPGSGLSNTGPFFRLQPGSYYYGTKYAPFPDGVWYFNFHNGFQAAGVDDEYSRLFAMAVRSGHVTAASVPEPGTLLLLGSGMAGLGLLRKFRNKKS